MIVQEILVEESSGLLQSRCIHCSPNISPAKIKKAIQNDIDNSLVAGFNPFEKYATVKLDYISPRIRGENKKYSKPMGIFAGTNTPPPFLFKESANLPPSPQPGTFPSTRTSDDRSIRRSFKGKPTNLWKRRKPSKLLLLKLVRGALSGGISRLFSTTTTNCG